MIVQTPKINSTDPMIVQTPKMNIRDLMIVQTPKDKYQGPYDSTEP